MRKKFILALLSLLLVPLAMMAQNVTIKSTNGSMIASVPYGTGNYNDTFFTFGGFATWQHDQLSMVLTASDFTTLTSFDQLADPANNLFSDGDKIQIGKGQMSGANICYLTLSLPKGYRFTGYTIKFSKSSGTITKTGSESGQFNTVDAASTFGETNSTFANYVASADVNRGGEATIGRTSQSENDMGNVLYFKLQGPSDSRAIITLESAEFFFTAEANYTPLTTYETDHRVSAVDIPFATGKVDYGSIENRRYGNTSRVSYDSQNVDDLKANLTLYEADAITDGQDFDGTEGKVVDYKAGSISIEDGYYRIGAADASNHDGTERIYYIETPTSAMLSDYSTQNPVAYRITGARIDYKYGPTNLYGDATKTYRTFYIKYNELLSIGDLGDRYMNSSGGMSTYLLLLGVNRAAWFIDEEGYIRTGANGRTYLTNKRTVLGNGNYASTTTNKNDALKFTINNNGQISYTENGTTYWLRRVLVFGLPYWRFQNNTGNRAETQNAGTTTINLNDIVGQSEGEYILRLYNKDGETYQEKRVDANTRPGYLSLDDMNNDAVKIGVIGTGLIQGTITVQALNPYLDQVTAVCEDKNPSRPIIQEQQFTASDFSVNGGEFFFYLPTAAAAGSGDQVEITFKDLKSRYFDDTYEGGSSSHNSRINLVKSAHYNKFGASSNNIYNDRNEAKNAQLERLAVNVVGTAAFKFNNAKDLPNLANSGNNSIGIFTEYPFSLESYTDGDTNNGSFGTLQLRVRTNDQSATRYLFTTDEARYNIAPTTATQHRAYAFYKMIAHVQAKTFTPVVEFKEIYDKTLYRELKADKTYGGAKEDAHYGAVVTVTEGDNIGVLSTTEILSAISDAIDNGGEDVPMDAKHLLYVDLSKLKGVYQDNSTNGTSMETFVESFAANAIVFLPQGASASNDNMAYKMESGFYAANNIVLTDMQPFYTPYDIRLRSANMVSYERKIEKYNYDKSTKASVMMPFAMEVNGYGVHYNEDGSTIQLHSMQSSAALTQIDGVTYAYFPALTYASSTQANCPYLVQVSGIPEDKEGFTVSQKGTVIVACPDVDNTTAFATWKNGRYLFEGESATGTATTGESAGDYDFINHGTYAGIKINKGDNVFYFANNMFVSSATLASSYSYANIAPFRAFYSTGDLSDLSGGAKLMNFGIIFGEGQGDVPTAIHAVDPALFIDVNAPVYDLQGRKVASSYREAKSLLQSGMYIVNGVKFVVK